MTLTPNDFRKIGAKLLSRDRAEEIKFEDTFIVWYCKTLQNAKGLIGFKNDDCYMEMTYNGDKDELYIDTYVKQSNQAVNPKDLL